jgi:hypothetical protein
MVDMEHMVTVTLTMCLKRFIMELTKTVRFLNKKISALLKPNVISAIS